MSTFDPHEDLYALLEVPPDASDDLIREQYRKLVQQYLWDRERFARINHAFEVLSDPQRRAEYDKHAAIARPQPALNPAVTTTLMTTQQIADVQRTQMSLRVTCPVCKTETPTVDGFCEECGFALEGTEGIVEEVSLEPPALPTLHDMQGNVYTLRPGVNTVGRLNADILLSDPSVSRSHARFLVQGDVVTLEDIGSTNGTFVNGQQLPPNVPIPLSDGAEISFGGAKLTLKLPLGVPAAPVEVEATLEPSVPPAAQTLTLGTEDESATSPEQVAEIVAYWCSEDGIMRVPLSAGVYTIGRKPTNHIVIPDPYVSGSHAVLIVQKEGISIEDVGSTNGTFVEDTKLIPHIAAPLGYGVRVQIGQGVYYVEAAEQVAFQSDSTPEQGEEHAESE